MYGLSRMLCSIAVLLAVSAAQAGPVEETLDHATFGKLAIYRATDEPKGVVLFASGAGGWNPDLAAAAQDMAGLDYVVAGINLDDYVARIERSDAACADVATDLDRLNRLMEERYPIATHQPPILLGQGAGAALAYAALAQGPDDRFHAGVAVDFCPQLPLRKTLCKGSANLESAALPDDKGVLLKPMARMPTTWFVFQNRPACDAVAATQFVKSIQLARLTDVSGADGAKAWLPQVSALLQWLDPGIAKQV